MAFFVAVMMTKSGFRSDCHIKYRSTTFARSAFLVEALEHWNSLLTAIRDSGTCA